MILNASADGKTVLRSYKREGFFNRNTRSLMTRLIISYEKNRAFNGISVSDQPDYLDKFTYVLLYFTIIQFTCLRILFYKQFLFYLFRISTDRFKKIAQLISELFPTESATTYFTPYRKVGNRKVNATGKLLEHFLYTKDKFKKNGLLSTSSSSGEQVAPIVVLSGKNNYFTYKFCIIF